MDASDPQRKYKQEISEHLMLSKFPVFHQVYPDFIYCANQRKQNTQLMPNTCPTKNTNLNLVFVDTNETQDN